MHTRHGGGWCAGAAEGGGRARAVIPLGVAHSTRAKPDLVEIWLFLGCFTKVWRSLNFLQNQNELEMGTQQRSVASYVLGSL